MPFLTAFFGEGSPSKIEYGKKGALILTSLLEDLVWLDYHIWLFTSFPSTFQILEWLVALGYALRVCEEDSTKKLRLFRSYA